jgi:hypothetical protein
MRIAPSALPPYSIRKWYLAQEDNELGRRVRKTSHKFRSAVATITTFALVKRCVACQ